MTPRMRHADISCPGYLTSLPSLTALYCTWHTRSVHCTHHHHMTDRQIARQTDGQRDWQTDTANIGKNSQHLMHSLQPNNNNNNITYNLLLQYVVIQAFEAVDQLQCVCTQSCRSGFRALPHVSAVCRVTHSHVVPHLCHPASALLSETVS